MAQDVFISYAHRDKNVADALCATLETRKVRCWIAPRDVLPGATYAEALIDALTESRIMVLVFSSHSNISEQVLNEVERAVSGGLPIIPFRIEDVPLSKSMAYFISRRHWLDALTPPLEKHLGRLADAVGALLAGMSGGVNANAEADHPDLLEITHSESGQAVFRQLREMQDQELKQVLAELERLQMEAD